MEREVTINNDFGLHFRPAMQLVDVASRFRSSVKLVKDRQIVDGKSIMEVMMLAATKGTTLVIRAEGEDAEDAVAALEHLVQENFEEEDPGPNASAASPPPIGSRRPNGQV